MQPNRLRELLKQYKGVYREGLNKGQESLKRLKEQVETLAQKIDTFKSK